MWLACLAGVVLLLLGSVGPREALASPVPSTASRLDEDDTRSFWRGWLLLDDPVLATDEHGRKKGQITPKSVFIAPVVQGLPDCAPGYRADSMGRCHRIVKIDQSAQLSFLLQKLNAMYAKPSKLGLKRPSTTTEGPLQVNIPFASLTAPSTPPPPPSSTSLAPSSSAPTATSTSAGTTSSTLSSTASSTLSSTPSSTLSSTSSSTLTSVTSSTTSSPSPVVSSTSGTRIESTSGTSTAGTSSTAVEFTTPAPVTELAELVVVAAEVEVKDEMEHSTSIPGAIVTLWHLNTTEDDTDMREREVTVPTLTVETSTPAQSTETEEAGTMETVSTPEDLTTITDGTEGTETTLSTGETEGTLEPEGTMETEGTPETVGPTETVGTTTELETTLQSENQTPTAAQTEQETSETTPVEETKTTATPTEGMTLEALLSSLLTAPPPPPVETSTPRPSLSVQNQNSDVKVVDSSDLSSENSADRPLRLAFPSTSHFTEGVQYPEESSQGQQLRWPSSDAPYPPSRYPQDERTPPQHGAGWSSPPPQPVASPPQQGWSWGPWGASSTTPVQRPLYNNFWSSPPQVPDPSIRTRTGLQRPPSRYPATLQDGRPAPFYYEELSGRDVADVFRHQVHQPWRHG